MISLNDLHHPIEWTTIEYDDADSPGREVTVPVCEECRRVETSDAAHWSDSGYPKASVWPCATTELLAEHYASVDTEIASLEHAVIESALALHAVRGAPADTLLNASRTLYRNTTALAEALKENTP